MALPRQMVGQSAIMLWSTHFIPAVQLTAVGVDAAGRHSQACRTHADTCIWTRARR